MKYPRIASYPRIFLRRFRIRRILERNLSRAHDEYQSVLHNPNKTQQTLLIATYELQSAHWALDQHKSRLILWEAEKLALDVPSQEEKPSWWRDDSENGEEPGIRWLSEKGRRGVGSLVRNERRQTWEWRVKVLTPILTIFVGLFGLLITLMTLMIKLTESRPK